MALYLPTRKLDFFYGTEFNGIGKEFRAYTNFGNENINNIKYMILKNWKSTVPNPTEYPYLYFYLKLIAHTYYSSTSVYDDFIIFD